MKVLATYSLKGGVGKTAAAVNLAYASAHKGHRTLVWDLDPQGAATFSFRIRPKVKGGAKALARGRRELEAAIKASDYERLDVVPADFSYRRFDVLLDNARKPRQRIRRLLGPLGDDYDVVILDCPPTAGLTAESMVAAADALLVPLIPTVLSVRTLDQLTRFLRRRRTAIDVLPFFSMVDRRRRHHRQIMADLPGRFPGILDAAIPMSSVVEQVSVERRPVFEVAPRSAASRSFSLLWAEIEAHTALVAGG